MTDYKRIRREPNYPKIRSIDVSMILKRYVYWLSQAYKAKKSEKNIIITHHASSIRSIPPGQEGNQISAACASHLDALIKNLAPNYWVHGHIHRRCDYQIGKTRVICHPKGYPDERKDHYENLAITV